MSKIRFVGLDVHAETVAVAVAEPNGEVRSLGLIPNRPESIRQLVRKLQPVEQVRFCYEAGPTGYVLYLLRRQVGLSEDVKEIAWKAQHRLPARYRKLLAQGKNKPQIVTAVGRELLGFIWAIGVKVETRMREPKQVAA